MTREPMAITARACGLEAPPPGEGLVTETWSVAACTRLAAGIVAVNCVEETKLVESAVPFRVMLDEDRKLVPVTATRVFGAPAATTDGDTEVTLGTGFEIGDVGGVELELPPPHAAKRSSNGVMMRETNSAKCLPGVTILSICVLFLLTRFLPANPHLRPCHP
jgi:hypothetical protein